LWFLFIILQEEPDEHGQGKWEGIFIYCLLLNDNRFLHITILSDFSSETSLLVLFGCAPSRFGPPYENSFCTIHSLGIGNDVFSGPEQISKATTLPRGLELSDLFVI
jgi:hypothetical protein